MSDEWNKFEYGCCTELSVASDANDVPIPQMTWKMLKDYLGIAAECVLSIKSGDTHGENNSLRGILDGLSDALYRVVTNGEVNFSNSKHPTAHSDDVSENIDIEDTPIKEELAGGISNQENKLEFRVQDFHAPRLTKDVPATAVFRMRGVRCKHCWMAFKGDTCVADLILHTTQRHSNIATPVFLERIRKKNSYKKILGDGILYCTCENCIFIGPAKLDTRFDKARRIAAKRGHAKTVYIREYSPAGK